ncbi:hypothetical protein PR048_007366 [Dryococelus australis]|uniref:Uncharacterized protein n=1 Tax=Dryococelus australis TaxID=614101 RepID=A0ABQ9HU06_9NEOP|nr:hypothetical protein PR048_007366 [Dryococelus australis]
MPMVAQWPECSPPTKANRVRFPAGSLPSFRMCTANRQVFSGISSAPLPWHSGTPPYLLRFTFTRSQDRDRIRSAATASNPRRVVSIAHSQCGHCKYPTTCCEYSAFAVRPLQVTHDQTGVHISNTASNLPLPQWRRYTGPSDLLQYQLLALDTTSALENVFSPDYINQHISALSTNFTSLFPNVRDEEELGGSSKLKQTLLARRTEKSPYTFSDWLRVALGTRLPFYWLLCVAKLAELAWLSSGNYSRLPRQLQSVTMATTVGYHGNYSRLPRQLQSVTTATTVGYHGNYSRLPRQLQSVTTATTVGYHGNYSRLPRQLQSVTMATTVGYHGNYSRLPRQLQSVTTATTVGYHGARYSYMYLAAVRSIRPYFISVLELTSILWAPNSSLSIVIGCWLFEKVFSYLTGLLRIRQHRHGSYVIHVENGGQAISLFVSQQGEPGSISGSAIPDFRMWESWQTMPLVAGFIGDFPFTPTSHSSAALFSPQSPSSPFKNSLHGEILPNPTWRRHRRIEQLDALWLYLCHCCARSEARRSLVFQSNLSPLDGAGEDPAPRIPREKISTEEGGGNSSGVNLLLNTLFIFQRAPLVAALLFCFVGEAAGGSVSAWELRRSLRATTPRNTRALKGAAYQLDVNVNGLHLTECLSCPVLFTRDAGAMVAEWLDCSSPTESNRVQSPAGSLPDFRNAGRCRSSVGFLGYLLFPLPFYSGAAPHSLNFTLIGSQDLVFKSPPKYFHSSKLTESREELEAIVSAGSKKYRCRVADGVQQVPALCRAQRDKMAETLLPSSSQTPSFAERSLPPRIVLTSPETNQNARLTLYTAQVTHRRSLPTMAKTPLQYFTPQDSRRSWEGREANSPLETSLPRALSFTVVKSFHKTDMRQSEETICVSEGAPGIVSLRRP